MVDVSPCCCKACCGRSGCSSQGHICPVILGGRKSRLLLSVPVVGAFPLGQDSCDPAHLESMMGGEGGLHKAHGGGCRDSCSEGQMEEQQSTGVQGRRAQDRGLGRGPSRGQLVGDCNEAASADKHKSCLQKEREKFQIIHMAKKYIFFLV